MTEAPPTERRVVFVRNVPFDATDAELEEACAAIGPVRRCFLVRPKGSEAHRGFGYVHFAIAEDAARAVHAADGIRLRGRKLQLHSASKRPPKEQRRKDTLLEADAEREVRKDGEATEHGVQPAEKEPETVVEAPEEKVATISRKRLRADSDAKQGKTQKGTDVPIKKKKESKEGQASDAQRSARTVVLAGLQGQAMKEEALALVQEIVTCVESPSELPVEELNQRSLARDGCKPAALALVCSSVRDARRVVAGLHGRQLAGGALWARQLGGEGSKLKKHRLIVRNLPYQIGEDELRKFFGAVGFVWELTLPRTPEGRLRGFGFVQYTSDADAQKALATLNATQIGGRPIAVDWSVPKSEFVDQAGGVPVTEAGLNENEGGNHELEAADAEDKADEQGGASEGELEKHVEEDSRGMDGHIDDGERMRKVLASFLAEADKVSDNAQKSKKTQAKERVREAPVSNNTADGTNKKKGERVSPVEKQHSGPSTSERCTVFVRGLPPLAQNSDLQESFAKFGGLRSCRLVLHPVTRRPQGTAFIEYLKAEGADTAVKAAKKGAGIAVLGRKIGVSHAVGRDEAKKIAIEKATKTQKEHPRNLHLLQEGVVLEGSRAAEGMSAADLDKRKRLEQEKASKLQSPRFVVSSTRLVVHNVPEEMTKPQLQRLLLDAVRKRATKQNPSISEVKILRNKPTRPGVSTTSKRGVAFVEFTETQHALVALRALNNHPDAFSPTHRPILEFALVDREAMKNRSRVQSSSSQRALATPVEADKAVGGAPFKKRKR